MNKRNTFLFAIIAVIFAYCSNPTIKHNNKVEDKDSVPIKNAGNDLVPYSVFWENSDSSKLNLSFLLDKPAGRDGFITIKDGHFVKPTGERFKIWGVNLTDGACFPEKRDAPAYAAFLARFGINAIRLHFLDRDGVQEKSLFNNELNTTRKLYAPQLDKLDFFISELKKAGIYIDINLNVGRTFRKGDGVPEYEYLGFSKAITLFDDHIIDLEKEYARQLLSHINPYTGNSYINEPAVALVEIVNENSLVEAWFGSRLLGKNTSNAGGTWIDISPYYGRSLTGKFNQWLKKNTNREDIAVIEKEAGIAHGSEIPRLQPKQFGSASELRFHTEAKFIIETERNFFTGMYHFLKEELKVRSLVIGTSDHNHAKSGYALLSNTSQMDVVDGHVYWQHPSTRTDQQTGKVYNIIGNTPMVNDPGFSTPVQLSRSAVEGKPYTVSETNHPFPNEYSCEGIPLISAYSLLQDWDGVFYYTIEHSAPRLWDTIYPGPFDIAMDPVKMSGMAACGLMFLRSDLLSAKSCVFRGYSEQELQEGIREGDKLKPLYTRGFSPLIPLIQKTRIQSFEKSISDFPDIGEMKNIAAETGEIIWHNDGINFVEISAPRTESLIGFTTGTPSLLKHLKVSLKNPFAAITLVSLDIEPISTSNNMLLIATGKSGLTGMKWDKDRKRLIEPGSKPTTIEVIKGEIILTGLKGASKMIVEPLDGAGNPKTRLVIPAKKGTVKINLGNEVTVWYHLRVIR